MISLDELKSPKGIVTFKGRHPSLAEYTLDIAAEGILQSGKKVFSYLAYKPEKPGVGSRVRYYPIVMGYIKEEERRGLFGLSKTSTRVIEEIPDEEWPQVIEQLKSRYNHRPGFMEILRPKDLKDRVLN